VLRADGKLPYRRDHIPLGILVYGAKVSCRLHFQLAADNHCTIGSLISMVRSRPTVMSVSLCLPVTALISRKPHGQRKPNFLCTLRPWLGPSPVPLQEPYYVLPVLWMTLYFHVVGSIRRVHIIFLSDVRYLRLHCWIRKKYSFDIVILHA